MLATSARPAGPSPRIRGECIGVCTQSSLERTIPANTGRMRTCPSRLNLSGDHPREYGENLLNGLFVSVSVGTIPANTGRIR